MKLLICSDGSAQAERALRFGTLVATACKAEVTLFGITEHAGQSERILDSIKRAQAVLESNKLPAELITKAGEPVEEIIRRSEAANYDLVVIGALRKQQHGLFWMSSKSYRIIKGIKPPVLSVAGKGDKLKRILVCSGGKRYIENAVGITGDLARGAAARVAILHVLPQAPPVYSNLPRIETPGSWLPNARSELGINLRSAKQSLEAKGVATEVRLRFGPVLDEILREIGEGDYDLVVVGSALSRGLRTYVLGDISREVVNRADCAVLVSRSLRKGSGLLPDLLAWFSHPRSQNPKG